MYMCVHINIYIFIYTSILHAYLHTYIHTRAHTHTHTHTHAHTQQTGGLEEALTDMHPGDAKMVFLIPELAYACPPGKVMISDTSYICIFRVPIHIFSSLFF